jgi:transcriptional regulator of met regulon
MEPEGPLLRAQEPAKSEALCHILYHAAFSGEDLPRGQKIKKLRKLKIKMYSHNEMIPLCSYLQNVFIRNILVIC